MLTGLYVACCVRSTVIAVGLEAFGQLSGARKPSRFALLFAYFLFACVTRVGAAPAAGTGGGVQEGETLPGVGPGALALHALSTHLLTADSSPPSVIDIDGDISDTVLLIVVATLLQPLLLLGTCGRRVLGRRYVLGTPRKSSVAVAHTMFERLLHAPAHCDAILVGESPEGSRAVACLLEAQPSQTHVARTPARRRALAASGVAFAWCSFAALMGTPLEHLAAAAATACAGFVGPVAQLSTLRERDRVGTAAFRFGNYEMRGIAIRPRPKGADETHCQAVLDNCRTATRALRGALDRAGETQFDEECRALCDQVKPADHGAVPMDISRHLPRFDDDWLSERPFSRTIPPVSAPYQPPKRQLAHCVQPPPGLKMQDLLEPRCMANFTRCAAEHLRDLGDLARGPDHPRWRPSACAYGLSCMLPRYRGCVLDFRDPAGAKLVDFSKPTGTHLNLEFFEREMASHPDQELLSGLVHGIRFQAELEEQFVMLSHLWSLAMAFDSVQGEIRRLAGLGWMQLYPHPPFWPMRATSQGGTPRKYEDRWRRTSDASAPHTLLFDSDSVPVVALNVASSEPRVVDGVSYPIPKEQKPTPRQVMRDLALLMHAATLTGEVVYLFTDDIKDYFNQLRLAPEEEWKSVVTTLAVPGDPGYDAARPSMVYVNERVLGFGTTRSSNYAQRLSNTLMDITRDRALVADRQISGRSRSPLLQRWLHRRRALSEKTHGSEDRRFFSHCYTDDALFGAVGIEATINLLRTWRGVTAEANLLMAIPKKREIGTMVMWLGILFFSVLGVAVVTPAKLLRAMGLVSRALATGLEFGDWRVMCGQLEHIRCVIGQPRLSQFGMYEPHRQQLGVADVVTPSALCLRSLAAWVKILSSAGGGSLLIAFKLSWAGTWAKLVVHTSSDAAREGTDTPGLGGYCNGLYWYYPLNPEELALLAIGVLELLAAVFNILALWPLVRDFEAIAHQCDALATPMVLAEHSAHSPLMQEAIAGAIDNETYLEAAESGKWAVAHLFGEGNVPADLVSRGHMVRFFELMRVMRVRPREVVLPAGAHVIMARVMAAARVQEAARSDTAPRVAKRDAWGRANPRKAARRSSSDLRPRRAEEVGEGMRCPSGKSTSASEMLADLLACDPRAEGLAVTVVAAAREGVASTGARRWTAEQVHTGSGPESGAPAGGGMPFPARGSTGTLTSLLACDSLVHAPPLAPPRDLQGKRSAYAEGVLPERPLASATAAHFEKLLLDDTSEFALRPTDMDAFRGQVRHVAAFIHAGVKPGTRKADLLGWSRHLVWCGWYNTPAFRSTQCFLENPIREALRECLFMLWINQNARPRSKRDVDVKPGCGLSNVLTVRRVLGYSGVQCSNFKLTRTVLNGMEQAHMLVHGKRSLLPRRKEPVPDDVLAGIYSIPDGTKCGPLVAGTHDFERLLDSISILEDTGMRKVELVRAPEELFLQGLTWEDITWRYGDQILANPTDEQLETLGDRWCVLVLPPNSKCDATGEVWGNKPIPIPWEAHEGNAVVRLARRWRELRIGSLPLSARQAMPVIADMAGYAYSGDTLDRYHNALLSAVCKNIGQPHLVSILSLHSYRIRLACKLRAAGARDGRIQAYCRWQCPESLHIYARWDLDEYVKWLRKARATSVRTAEGVNLPALEHGSKVAMLAGHLRRQKNIDDLVAPEDGTELGLFRQPKGTRKRAAAPVKAPPKPATGRARACKCGGIEKVPRKRLPGTIQAVWNHAPKKCYFTYVHQTLGSFQSLVAAIAAVTAARRAVTQNPPSPKVRTVWKAGAHPGKRHRAGSVDPSTRRSTKVARAEIHVRHSQPDKDRYKGRCGTPGCQVKAVNGRHAGPHRFADGSMMLA